MTNDGFSGLGEPPEGLEYSQVDHDLLGSTEIHSRFGFHKATIEGAEATKPKHAELRQAFIDFATYLDKLLGSSREKSEAFTHLEDASMWSHKAIAKTAPLELEQ